MIEVINIALNALLGGGLIVTLVTLKSAREKASAEAIKLRLDNTEQATQILIENIVEPLKKEMNGIRKDITRLRKAIEKANGCRHSDDCPVIHELRKQETNADAEQARDSNGRGANSRHRNNDRARQRDDESAAELRQRGECDNATIGDSARED